MKNVKTGVNSVLLAICLLVILGTAPSCQRLTVREPASIRPPANIIAAPDVPSSTFRFIVFGDVRNSNMKKNRVTKGKPAGKAAPNEVPTPPTGKGAPEICRCENTKDGLTDAQYLALRDRTITEVCRRISETEAAFALFSGDMVYKGKSADDWNRVKRLAGDRMKLIYPVLGNHELWGGPEALKNFYGSFPQIAPETAEVEKKPHHYAFFAGKNAFIALCSGAYGPGGFNKEREASDDASWNCLQKDFKAQMAWTKQVLDYGRMKHDIDNVFIQYHKPSFSSFKHPPLSDAGNPIHTLKEYSDTVPALNFYVFNGHNHTTELYHPYEGSRIVVLVAGGGGAPQKYCPDCRHGELPEILRDRGLDRNATRINFYEVTVSPDGGAGYITENYYCNGSWRRGFGFNVRGDIANPEALDLDSNCYP